MNLTGSQHSVAKTGVMCSNVLVLVKSLADTFWTASSLESDAWLIPQYSALQYSGLEGIKAWITYSQSFGKRKFCTSAIIPS